MLSKVLEMDVYFHRDTAFGEHGNFYEEFERYVKNVHLKRSAFSTEALFGNLEGVCLLGLLREKENAYLGPFSWTQRTLEVTFGGHLEL